jgi:hypothetical protein
MGKYTPRTPMFCVSYFKVIVLLDKCITTKINPSYLPKELVFEMSYGRFVQPEIIKFKDWQESFGTCKPFIYKAMSTNGNNLPSFIKFFPNARKFSIRQTPEMSPGSYLVVLRGVISSIYLMDLVTFNVIVKC